MTQVPQELRQLALEEDSLGLVRVEAADLLRWAELIESLDNQLIEALERMV